MQGTRYSGNSWLTSHYRAKAPARDVHILSLPVSKGSKILDVAAGPGYFTELLARMTGSGGEVVALDADADHIAAIQGRESTSQLSNISTIHADFEAHDFKQKFDVVFCSNFVCYFRDPSIIIDKFLSIMNPGGSLIIRESDARNIVIGRMPDELARQFLYPPPSNYPSESFPNNFTAKDIPELVSAYAPTSIEIVPLPIVLKPPLTKDQEVYVSGFFKLLGDEKREVLSNDVVQEWLDFVDTGSDSYILDKEGFFFSMTEYAFCVKF